MVEAPVVGFCKADVNPEGPLQLYVPPPVEEIDQRDILATDLYTSSSGVSTGIAINIDIPGVVPGTYSYIRFSAPAGDVDGHMEIDAIETIFP